MTKDGAIAGPRTLEHLVDVVLSFEGDRHARLRLVRAVKNRYGPTDEIGCFELGETGLTELADPTGLFVTDRADPCPGTCITVALGGKADRCSPRCRPWSVPNGEVGARAGRLAGMDPARIAMVLAVLERRQSVPMSRFDTYVAPVGGARLTEPGSDLAVALAVYGSTLDLSLPFGWVALGEIGLAGEVRRVSRDAPATRRGRPARGDRRDRASGGAGGAAQTSRSPCTLSTTWASPAVRSVAAAARSSGGPEGARSTGSAAARRTGSEQRGPSDVGVGSSWPGAAGPPLGPGVRPGDGPWSAWDAGCGASPTIGSRREVRSARACSRVRQCSTSTS